MSSNVSRHRPFRPILLSCSLARLGLSGLVSRPRDSLEVDDYLGLRGPRVFA